MILPRGYIAIELETEAGSRRYHDALIYLATPEGRQGRPWVGVLRDIARTHTEVPNDDRGAWARLFLLRTEGEGEVPAAPAPGIRVWLPGEDVPGLLADPTRTYGTQLVGVPYLRGFLAYLGEGVEADTDPVQAPLEPVPETEPESAPAREPQAEPEPEPEPDRRPPPQTTTPPVPLVAGASVVVESRLGGSWTTAFVRDGRVIATDDGRVAPWVDPRAPGRLTTVLKSALDRVGVPIERRAVRDAIGDWISALQEVGDGDRVVSAAVSRVIGLTDRVLIEQTRPPTFVITLGDEEFVLTNTEMASNLTKRINELWLGVFYERLGASAHDWDAIRDYWLSIAERGEPWGDRTPYDGVTSALQIRISAEPMFDVREGLIRSGLYRDQSGIVWVNNSVVQEVLSSGGGDLSIAGFSAHLRREGYLVQTSTVHRVGGITVRAWGFAPGFRADEGVSQTSTNTVRGVEMNE